MELQPVAEMLGQSEENNDPSSFKSLLVTGLRYIILTFPLPSIHSCSSFIRGGGGMKSTRVDRPFKPKYIQYSVSSTFAAGCSSQARSVFPVASTS